MATATRQTKPPPDPEGKRAELEAKGEFVNPLREETYPGPMEEPPIMIDVDLTEEAREIFKDDLVVDAPAKPEATLHEKLIEVMAAVDSVGKRGENTSQGYKYQKAVDVFNAVRPEFIKRGMLFTTEVTSSKTTLIERQGLTPNVLVEITCQFYVSDGSQTFRFGGAGAGIDASGDKSVYKAITGAMKYGIRQLLMLPDENDPEKARPEEREDVEGTHRGPITITGSNASGVMQGGRQTKATSAQLDAIKKAARELMLTPETMAAHIVSTLGSGPELTGDVNADSAEVLRYLAALSFDECGKVVKELVAATETVSGGA